MAKSSVIGLGKVGERVLLLGNEAVARGAVEAGVQVASSYPGTPSSEILEAIASVSRDLRIYSEWSTNEKVAFEVAIGAAISGVRAISSMKHVGVNWAADPLFSINQTGVIGGLVLVTADDPGAYASQNEQDNRFYALASELLMLEPADVQEAKDMTVKAFDISEELELPVMLRLTSRICHARADVTLGPLRKERRQAKFNKDPKRWVMMAGRSRPRHKWLHDRLPHMQEIVEKLPFNKLEIGGNELGIITSGVSYSYVKEAVSKLKLDNRVSILKVATYPIPKGAMSKLLSSVATVLVFEEVEPIIEQYAKTVAFDQGKKVEIKGRLTGEVERQWDLNVDLVIDSLSRVISVRNETVPAERQLLVEKAIKAAPPRLLALCAGCPHTATYYALKRAVYKLAKGPAIYSGDIGCYTLGANVPIDMQDTNYCMGASIGVGCGFSQAGVKEPIIATIGDSTFLHAGIPALINAVYNRARLTVVVFDNRATAMTGFQPHPGTGITATGDKTKEILIEDVARACGAGFVEVVDPHRLEDAIAVMRKGLGYDGVSVIVSRGQCIRDVLREARRKGAAAEQYEVDWEKCNGCKVCISMFGCPALTWRNKEKRVEVDHILCAGCGVCAQVCPLKAIHPVGVQ
ncbi:MAG TPA: indolepyruvate ferredoxin oxidoreductase subunit alpha [Candidatus Acidoferrales bacterium]|nr:indolepyruvate ferredoxin oxidoreductase subunit alpha [Candidatus Acidoferrales bacterium]